MGPVLLGFAAAIAISQGVTVVKRLKLKPYRVKYFPVYHVYVTAQIQIEEVHTVWELKSSTVVPSLKQASFHIVRMCIET